MLASRPLHSGQTKLRSHDFIRKVLPSEEGGRAGTSWLPQAAGEPGPRPTGGPKREGEVSARRGVRGGGHLVLA